LLNDINMLILTNKKQESWPLYHGVWCPCDSDRECCVRISSNWWKAEIIKRQRNKLVGFRSRWHQRGPIVLWRR